MPDLICYLPNHGYSDNATVFVSWLDSVYNIDDPQANSFKLTDGAAGLNIQFDSTVTDGFIREVSSGITEITGLGHLEGKTVNVTAEGVFVGSFVVSNGSVTVLDTIYTYQVGIPYAWKVKTTRFAIPGGQNVQTRIKRINETTLRYIRSQDGQGGQEYDGVEYLDNLNATFSTKSKDATILTQGGFHEDGSSVIKGAKPSPFTGLGIVVQVEIWEP